MAGLIRHHVWAKRTDAALVQTSCDNFSERYPMHNSTSPSCPFDAVLHNLKMNDSADQLAPTRQQLSPMSPSEQVKAIKQWFYARFGRPNFNLEQTTADGSFVSVFSASFEEEEELRDRFESILTPELFTQCVEALVYETQIWLPDEDYEFPQELVDAYAKWLQANPTFATQSLIQRIQTLKERIDGLSGYNGGPVSDALTDKPPLTTDALRALRNNTSRIIQMLSNNMPEKEEVEDYRQHVKQMADSVAEWIKNNVKTAFPIVLASFAAGLGTGAADVTVRLVVDLFYRMYHVLM